jgi:hypothetical protein
MEEQIHHQVDEHEQALAIWRRARTLYPQDFRTCTDGINHLAAMAAEARVDSLIAECFALPGAPRQGPARTYFNVTNQYLVAGHLAEARHAAARITLLLAPGADTSQSNLRDLGELDCMFGDWAAAYPRLKASLDTGSYHSRILLAIAAAHMGDTATVNATRRWIDEYEISSSMFGEAYQARSMIVLAGGDRTAALALLRTALTKEKALTPMLAAWHSSWEFAPLRGDPRWAAMLAPVD